MHEFVTFALLGLGAGSVYVLLAQGVVLIYRGSGVVNLAHGAFAMLGAYIFNILHVTHAWATVPAIAITIGTVASIGVAVDQVVLRRMRTAAALSRLMVTLGVVLAASAVANLFFGSSTTVALSIIPPHPVDVFGVTIASTQLWLLGIACAVTLVLSLIWRFTRVGWITEAVAERERVAAALGWSPELVSAVTWGVGAGLAAMAGILVAPLTGLSQTNLTLIVIPALAACLIGNFRSFGLTLVAGILIGMLQSEVGNLVHLSGAGDAFPLLVVVAVMVARGSSLPLRGESSDELPAVGTGQINWRLVVIAAIVGLIGLSLISSTNWQSALATTFGSAIVLLSIVVLTGYAGQVSLCQFALAGIGALVAARLTADHGFPFIVALVAGALGAMVVGVIFALPALRARGVNLAVVTLALGLATQSLVFNNPTLSGSQIGIQVGDQHLFGWDINPVTHSGRYTLVVFGVFILCCLLVANLRRSRAGRRLLAVRANERAASASGINVLTTKLYAFAVSGALAGAGGVLLAFQSTSVIFASGWDPITSITAVAQAVIGGVGFVLGPLLGAPLSQGSFGSLLSVHFEHINSYISVIASMGLFVALIQSADGMAKPLSRIAGRLPRSLLPDNSTVEPDAPTAPRPIDGPGRLLLENVTVRYGGVVAVDGVNLEVRRGQVVGLIGPNGAGKTSLMDAISGFAKSSGAVWLDSQRVDTWAPYRRSRAGLVRSFQGLELFSELTVRENLLAVGEAPGASSLLLDLVRPKNAQLSDIATAAVHEFGLADALDLRPGELSYGRRRLVAIARAVATKPAMLMLDEPVAGLDDGESLELSRLVRRLADEWQMGVLVIEHDMNFVMGIADRVDVLNFGKLIASGTPQEIRADQQAVAAYLGEGIEQVQVDGPLAPGESTVR